MLLPKIVPGCPLSPHAALCFIYSRDLTVSFQVCLQGKTFISKYGLYRSFQGSNLVSSSRKKSQKSLLFLIMVLRELPPWWVFWVLGFLGSGGWWLLVFPWRQWSPCYLEEASWPQAIACILSYLTWTIFQLIINMSYSSRGTKHPNKQLAIWYFSSVFCLCCNQLV